MFSKQSMNCATKPLDTGGECDSSAMLAAAAAAAATAVVTR